MRSASLFAVLALVFVLTVSSFSPATAGVYAFNVAKVTTNGDTETVFVFRLTTWPGGSTIGGGHRRGGESPLGIGIDLVAGDYALREDIPPGWALVDVDCVGIVTTPPWSTFERTPDGVIIHYVLEDSVTCTFTNSPVSPPVGGVVQPAKAFALLSPWLIIIGLVGCIGTVVVAKKRKK